MPAGRPRKPIERRNIEAKGDGQAVSHSVKTGEIVSRNPRGIAIPPAPNELGERGQLEWYRIWEAGITWLHPNEDYHWVLQASQSYDDIQEFREKITETGLIVKGYTKDMLVANPLIKEVRMAEATIRKCLSMLGFSPSDRARLGIAEVKLQSGLQDLQNKTRKNRGSK